MFHIYTDGSTLGNGKENACGAYAFAVFRDDESAPLYKFAAATKGTTNNREELKAVLEGINYLLNNSKENDEITVYSDSAYFINCIKQKWFVKWESNGWITSKKTPVLNKDLWETLIPFFTNPKIHFEKVKGHADNERNNLVDGLARNASMRLEVENG